MFNNTVEGNLILPIIFFVTLGVARLLTPLSGKIAYFLGVIDHPNDRKVHSKPMPRTGGLVMALALALGLVFFADIRTSTTQAFLLGASMIVFTGVLDDMIGLSSVMKFSGQILAALAFILLSGYRLATFGNILGFGELSAGSGLSAVIITLFCMVGVINAFNLADGLDGLSGGLGFIAALFMAFVAYEIEASQWLLISLAFLGVLLGFLSHNHYPAKVFMGDTGSLLLGYSMAAIAIGLTQSNPGRGIAQPITMGIIVALPVFDTIWVMVGRFLKKQNPFKADKTHLHHRFLHVGIHHTGVVGILYVLMLILGCFAWYATIYPEWLRFYTVLIIFISGYISIHLIEKQGFDMGKWIASIRLFRRRRHFNVEGGLMGFFMRSMSWLIPFSLLVPLITLANVPNHVGIFAFSSAFFVGLLYPWYGRRSRLLLGHGILYVGIYLLMIIYIFTPDSPSWVAPMLYTVGALAFVWVLVEVAVSRQSLTLYPCAIEILMLFSSWSVPLIVLPMLGVEMEQIIKVVHACILALTMLCFMKLSLQRKSFNNIAAAGVLTSVFILIGLMSLL